MLLRVVRSSRLSRVQLDHGRSACKRSRNGRQLHASVPRQQDTPGEEDIDEILSNPTWSVESLLPTEEQINQTTEISREQLHHLLRLCALPKPKDSQEEAQMLRDLKAQLHFVKEVQKVDTAGITPLESIRDESEAALNENRINVDSLKDALDREEIIGKYHKRIRIRNNAIPPDRTAEQWDVLGQAPRKSGRYFKVEIPSE